MSVVSSFAFDLTANIRASELEFQLSKVMEQIVNLTKEASKLDELIMGAETSENLNNQRIESLEELIASPQTDAAKDAELQKLVATLREANAKVDENKANLDLKLEALHREEQRLMALQNFLNMYYEICNKIADSSGKMAQKSVARTFQMDM